MGTAGAGLFIASIAIFIMSGYSATATFIFVVIAITALVAVLKFSLARVRKAKPESGLYDEHAQDGYVASEYEKDVIGEEGTALSDLKPSGHIAVHSQRYQAVSERGYINKGSKITVIGGRGAYLIVKNAKEDKSS